MALTGYGSKSRIVRRSEHAGFDHHLVKPVDPDTLEGLLAEWSLRRSGKEMDTAC